MRYLILSLLFCAVCLNAAAKSVEIRLFPEDLPNTRFTVKVDNSESGKHFQIFYKTNEYDLPQFISVELQLTKKDKIASIPVEQKWENGGVTCQFTVSSKYIGSSKFYLTQIAHNGNQVMPGADAHWFFLRDFVKEDPKEKSEAERRGD